MQNSQKNWQVQVQGQIFDVELETLKQWIVEGSVSLADTARQGDVCWQPVEKVPALRQSCGSENAAHNISPASGGDNPQTSGKDEERNDAQNATGELYSRPDKPPAETTAERGGNRKNIDFRESLFHSAKYYKNLIRQSLRNKPFLR